MDFSVYIIKNSENKLYTGVTSNINERINCHNLNRGANFTKNNKEFKLVLQEKYNTLKEARTREIQIKKWRRQKKELLIEKYIKGLETKVK